MPAPAGGVPTVDAEDALRAQLYRLLSRLLAAPPDRARARADRRHDG